MIYMIAISLIIAGLGMSSPPADNWVIISHPNGTELQGECIEYWDIEKDGEQWYKLNINGNIYEMPKNQISFTNK